MIFGVARGAERLGIPSETVSRRLTKCSGAHVYAEPFVSSTTSRREHGNTRTVKVQFIVSNPLICRGIVRFGGQI